VRILPAKTAANARRFLRDLHRACPITIAKILTDNGKEFTDRLSASRARAPSGEHEFDMLCAELGIEHRLTPPKSPQTNGMVERFNGRISDVLKTNRFDSALDLEQTLMRYVHLYNTQLPQSVLRSRTPMQAMKDWHKSHPHLFVKSPRNHTGRDSYRFKASSETVKKKRKEATALTPSYSADHNDWVGQISMKMPGQFSVTINNQE
jgi:hypothetical protein